MNPHSRLSVAFLRDHPEDAAHILEDFPAENAAQLLSVTSPAVAEHLIEHLSPGYAVECLLSIAPSTVGQIFARLDPELQVKLLRQLDFDQRESLLDTVQSGQADAIRRLLPYNEGTAGSLMEAPLANVPEDLSVRDAIRRIKRIRSGLKFYIYVTNANGQLTGVITLHELINARQTITIGQVMHRHVVSLSPAQSLVTVFNSPYWLEYHALPVTDSNNVLLGVIRQKGMRRFQEQSLHVDAVNSGLGALVTVSELFSVTAAQMLGVLVSIGTSPTDREYHE